MKYLRNKYWSDQEIRKDEEKKTGIFENLLIDTPKKCNWNLKLSESLTFTFNQDGITGTTFTLPPEPTKK